MSLTNDDLLAEIRRPFGAKDAPTKTEPGAWRSGPPGVKTEAEVLEAIRLPFVSTGTVEDRQRRARVAETDRQIVEEQRLLRLAADHGWEWVRANSTAAALQVTESVRARLGGSTATELRESAAAALVDAGLRVQLREASAAPKALTGRRIEVTLISPGWGSSGYYSAALLEQAARDKVFAKGLPMYLDHPTQRELHERPERSVRDLAGSLAQDARWTGRALVGEAEVLPQHAALVAGLEGVAGMSIRASADVSMGEAEGRRGRIVGRIVEAQSVDFVTRAGRGGTFRVLESERPAWGW